MGSKNGMLTKVKKVIQAIEELNGTEQQAFLEKLPNALKPSVGKRPLTDTELAQLGRLSRSYRRKWAQGKTRAFRSWKSAARHGQIG